MDLKTTKTITLHACNGSSLGPPIKIKLDADIEEADIIQIVDQNLYFIAKTDMKLSFLYIIEMTTEVMLLKQQVVHFTAIKDKQEGIRYFNTNGEIQEVVPC